MRRGSRRSQGNAQSAPAQQTPLTIPSFQLPTRKDFSQMSVVEGEAYLAEKRAWLKILLANATSYAARRASRGVFTAYDSFNLQSIEHEKDMLRLFDELIDLLQQNQQNP